LLKFGLPFKLVFRNFISSSLARGGGGGGGGGEEGAGGNIHSFNA